VLQQLWLLLEYDRGSPNISLLTLMLHLQELACKPRPVPRNGLRTLTIVPVPGAEGDAAHSVDECALPPWHSRTWCHVLMEPLLALIATPKISDVDP
jgi:hypothetical protein